MVGVGDSLRYYHLSTYYVAQGLFYDPSPWYRIKFSIVNRKDGNLILIKNKVEIETA